MREKNKKIGFMPVSNEIGMKLPPPRPARSFIPDWYRKADRFIGGKMEIRDVGGLNKDIKLCVPFLDALMGGYCIELPTSLIVKRDSRGVTFFWHEYPEPIENRPKNMAVTLPRPSGHDEDLYAWKTVWGVVTPPGYSAIYTHPMNRFDLPFITTSGIMDTDVYSGAGEIPFFLKKDFEGIIEAGTPIVQVFPFKRDAWEHEILETDNNVLEKKRYLVQRVLFDGYKKLFWQRKQFD
jgi:hypothetical protein